ncbi:MAG: FAD-dependent oxidoreductase, partial [Armatimonadota bacterium]
MMLDEWQCTVCGHIHKGGAPPTDCPTCGAPFTAFERRELDPSARFRDVEIATERPAGYRYVIIGNSAAGRSAARAIQALHADGQITVISDDPAPFYMRPLLPDLIGGADRTRVFGVASDYDETSIEMMLGETARELDAASKQVLCESGTAVPFDALLLATGSSPVQIPWPGSEAEGIAYLRTLADAEQVMALARGAKHAVVVGGGFLGLEFVRAFAALGLKVTQLIRDEHVGSPALDGRAAGLIQEALEDAGVTVALEEQVESFESENGRVSGVRTSQGRTIECALVGVAVGARARLELAEGTGLEIGRGVIVDGRLQSSIPDVYAAGDVAQASDVAWGEQRVNTSWRNAREQGEAAGIAMAGGAVDYPGALPSNYQQAAGLAFCVLGIATPPDEDSYDTRWDMDEAGRTYLKTVERDGILVGATLVGDLTQAAAFERGIRERTSAADAMEAPAPAPAAVPPQRVEPVIERKSGMRKMTEENISTSFAGESQAHMKYL